MLRSDSSFGFCGVLLVDYLHYSMIEVILNSFIM